VVVHVPVEAAGCLLALRSDHVAQPVALIKTGAAYHEACRRRRVSKQNVM
jgi:hypothetical protein